MSEIECNEYHVGDACQCVSCTNERIRDFTISTCDLQKSVAPSSVKKTETELNKKFSDWYNKLLEPSNSTAKWMLAADVISLKGVAAQLYIDGYRQCEKDNKIGETTCLQKQS